MCGNVALQKCTFVGMCVLPVCPGVHVFVLFSCQQSSKTCSGVVRTVRWSLIALGRVMGYCARSVKTETADPACELRGRAGTQDVRGEKDERRRSTVMATDRTANLWKCIILLGM